MHNQPTTPPLAVAIACGGTGGHLFPGLSVAERLRAKNCSVTLLISPKDVDQKAIKGVTGMRIVTLPAVGLERGKKIAFLRGFVQSFRQARKLFRAEPAAAALAMGGFTSAPPVLAAKLSGARTFLHESNTISGRANRLLAHFVDGAFVGFPQTASTLKVRRVTRTGTPVRPSFQPQDAGTCRQALGLDPTRPVMLVMGGSQGASGINDLVVSALPLIAKVAPDLQWFHLTGAADEEKVRHAYSALNLRAIVHPFYEHMNLALGAATLGISRAGASSLAELAATLVPSILIPYPAATDNHQFYNAKEFVDTGAAVLLEQRGARPDSLLEVVLPFLNDSGKRAKMQAALQSWQAPRAADHIAEAILRLVGNEAAESSKAANDPAEAAIPKRQKTGVVQNLPENESRVSVLDCACPLALFGLSLWRCLL